VELALRGFYKEKGETFGSNSVGEVNKKAKKGRLWKEYKSF